MNLESKMDSLEDHLLIKDEIVGVSKEWYGLQQPTRIGPISSVIF